MTIIIAVFVIRRICRVVIAQSQIDVLDDSVGKPRLKGDGVFIDAVENIAFKVTEHVARASHCPKFVGDRMIHRNTFPIGISLVESENLIVLKARTGHPAK